MKNLAIITTHPIQYYAPVFKLLSERGNIGIKVFYTLGNSDQNLYDAGFGKMIAWDLPLLDGYPYEWVKNIATQPGSHHPKGIDNPDLIAQINAYQPDAILLFGWNYTSHLKVLRYFKNKLPVYFRGDSTLLTALSPLKSFIKSVFLKWVYKHVDHAFYVGTNNKAYFKKYGLRDNQLSFAPHAVDNSRFEQDRSRDANELRSSLNISADAFLIVYAGKFDTVKNLPFLIDGFSNLNQPNVHLLLVGNGVNEDALKIQASASRVKNNIHFLSFVNQSYMPAVYQAADVYCLPSLSETWGLSVNEAMACGKAVLISDKVGCGEDLVKNNINGYIFKSEDANELLTCLKLLTTDKIKLAEFGKKSSLIIEPWSFLNIARAIEEKLNEKI